MRADAGEGVMIDQSVEDEFSGDGSRRIKCTVQAHGIIVKPDWKDSRRGEVPRARPIRSALVEIPGFDWCPRTCGCSTSEPLSHHFLM